MRVALKGQCLKLALSPLRCARRFAVQSKHGLLSRSSFCLNIWQKKFKVNTGYLMKQKTKFTWILKLRRSPFLCLGCVSVSLGEGPVFASCRYCRLPLILWPGAAASGIVCFRALSFDSPLMILFAFLKFFFFQEISANDLIHSFPLPCFLTCLEFSLCNLFG